MDFTPTEEQEGIRKAIKDLCKDFADPYWRELDKTHAYPEAFVKALTEAGWLAMLIPEQYGGSGLGITEAAIVLEEVNHAGGNAADRPRPDVHHGHPPAARQRRAEAALPAAHRLAVSCACRPSASPSPTPAPRPRALDLRQCASATST